MRNPFIATFGGKPDILFGRQDILMPFEQAFDNPGSMYRSIFITGRRGTGKTTLATHLALEARDRHGWQVFDVLSLNAAEMLFSKLKDFDEISNTIDPQIGFQVMGTGGTLKGASSSKIRRYALTDMPDLLMDTCKRSKQGVCIVIDEIQKVSIEDMALICSSVQNASKYGEDIMLIAAGLPGSYDRLATSDQTNTTYVQRAMHFALGMLEARDIFEGYHSVFDEIGDIDVPDRCINQLAAASYGYPYLVQLLGYFVFEEALAKAASSVKYSIGKQAYAVQDSDVEKAIDKARALHEQNVIVPNLKNLKGDSIKFLAAMCECYDEESGLAKSSDVNKLLGKSPQALSTVRRRLIDRDLIYSPMRNQLGFTIPYLRHYIGENPQGVPASDAADSTLMRWKL